MGELTRAIGDGPQDSRILKIRRVPGARLATGAAAARRPLVLPLLLLVFAAASCGGTDWRVTQLYGGGTSIDVLSKPQAVEAFRIDPGIPAPVGGSKDEPAAGAAAAPRLGEYRITAGPVAVDAATAAELSSILLDPDTYDWVRAKGCEFRPGVGLRFVKDASRVEMALCFECDELMIWRLGRRIGMEDFDAARPRLVAVVKKLFPDDPKIQALE
jgi:hypothetical protein